MPSSFRFSNINREALYFFAARIKFLFP